MARVNNEEEVVSYMTALLQHLFGVAEKNHEDLSLCSGFY
jgi:hypothetical protein